MISYSHSVGFSPDITSVFFFMLIALQTQANSCPVETNSCLCFPVVVPPDRSPLSPLSNVYLKCGVAVL